MTSMTPPTQHAFLWIENNQQLKHCCENAMQKPYVMLDTEFIRTRTFYAKLGLIQLFDGEQISLIDPLTISDFSPFICLLTSPKVVKVLHACSEDLGVFWHYFKQLPTPMVDTQLVAQFLGFGASMGFASLLQHYFHFELDKGEARTDWLARPLSLAQLKYACADVEYLLPLYQALMQALALTPWENALHMECEALCQKAKSLPALHKCYLSIPHVQKLQGNALLRLQKLCAWRYEEAEKSDLAVNFVVKGEHLWQVAKFGAKSLTDLRDLGLHPREVRHHGKKILQILAYCDAQGEQHYPSPVLFPQQFPHYKALKQKVKEALHTFPMGYPADLLINKKRLDAFLLWYMLGKEPTQLPDLLQGWRKPFGEILLKALDRNEKHPDFC